MAQIKAQAEREVRARTDAVYALLADYREGRPRLLTDNFLDYRVEQGGRGAGTVVAYRFRGGGRERDFRLRVDEPAPGRMLREQDERSSFRTTWNVTAAGDGDKARVSVETTWRGGSGVGGFFERLFAPRGMRRVYDAMLERLDHALAGR